MASARLGIATRGGAVLAVAVWASAGCAGGETADDEPTPAEVHWGYTGDGGPEHWSEIDESFSACGQGLEQSPIDVVPTHTEDLPDLTFDYAHSPVSVVNNGHTVQVGSEPDNVLVADGDSYELQQFHYHVPSEHTVEGRTFEGELHLVHAADDGGLAVVAVLLSEGEPTQAYQPWLDLLDTATDTESPAGELDLATLLPPDRSTYRYQGSLTTPPCSEGVEWFVLSTPVELSRAQLDLARGVFDGITRPVQPLGDRDVVFVPAP